MGIHSPDQIQPFLRRRVARRTPRKVPSLARSEMHEADPSFTIGSGRSSQRASGSH